MKNYFLTIVAMAGLAFVSCKEKKIAEEAAKKFELSDTMAKMIALDSVENCYISDAISLSGEVGFNENNVNKVFPRGSGQVVECKVTLGDKVTEGQVLATIRSAEIAGNYSDLKSADADLAIAKRAFENTSQLYQNGIASERELNEAKQNYEKAKTSKTKLENILSINGGKNTNATGSYNLVAPISGYIVEKKVNTGNFIRPDMGDYLFTVSDLKDVWVFANVFEADIPKVKEGFAVKISTLAYPDKMFDGKIDKVSEVLDPVNKVMKVRVKLDNASGLLKPQMFARVIVSNHEKQKAICVPTKSLLNQDGKSYVVVYRSAKDMSIEEVELIKTVAEKTFVKGRLQPGEKLIVNNQLLIFQQLLTAP